MDEHYTPIEKKEKDKKVKLEEPKKSEDE